jgi:hypothetical protein
MSDEYRLDLNGDDEDDAVTRTTCARCNVPFEGEDLDAAAREHEARCFVPGDLVRWEYGVGPHDKPENWVEGRLVSLDEIHAEINVARCGLGTRVGRGIIFGLFGAILRRIPPIAHCDVKPESLAIRLAVREVERFKADQRAATEPVRGLSAEGQATYDRLRAEYGTPRPDGFSQSRIDALKAAMLAPAGKVRR